MSTTTSLQQTLTTRAVDVLSCDVRVAAAWMKGSLVTGAAGRYSDIDLGVAVYDEHFVSFCADRRKILAAIGSLAGIGEAAEEARVTVALFDDPIEFDLTVDPLSASETYGPEIGWILFDKTEGQITAAQSDAQCAMITNSNRAREIVTAFWLRAPRMRRWVAQADLHRAGNELQKGRNWLVELMLIANQPNKAHQLQKDSFVLLSSSQWNELRTVYLLYDFSPQGLAHCMMRLSEAFSGWGRAACARQGSEYPSDLEKVSVAAVSQFYESVFGPFVNGRNGRESK